MAHTIYQVQSTHDGETTISLVGAENPKQALITFLEDGGWADNGWGRDGVQEHIRSLNDDLTDKEGEEYDFKDLHDTYFNEGCYGVEEYRGPKVRVKMGEVVELTTFSDD